MRRAMEKEGVLMNPMAKAMLRGDSKHQQLDMRGSERERNAPRRNEPTPPDRLLIPAADRHHLDRSKHDKRGTKDQHRLLASWRQLAVVDEAR